MQNKIEFENRRELENKIAEAGIYIKEQLMEYEIQNKMNPEDFAIINQCVDEGLTSFTEELFDELDNGVDDDDEIEDEYDDDEYEDDSTRIK